MKTPSLIVGCALISLFLLAPSSASPQDKQGTVNVDSLAVFSKMSTESDTVQTLTKGTVVRILITVTNEEGNWCGVASQNGSSRIGYVLCSALDQPKDTPVVATQGGSRLQILIGSAHVTAQTSKLQAHRSGDVDPVGQTLAPLPGYSWSSNPKTLVIAIRRGCPYCDASMPFYRRLGEQENSSVLHAHVLVVMPNDEATGSRVLSKGGLEVQAIFGQKLEALNVSGTPTVLLLNSNGRIEHTWVGQLPPQLEKEVINAASE